MDHWNKQNIDAPSAADNETQNYIHHHYKQYFEQNCSEKKIQHDQLPYSRESNKSQNQILQDKEPKGTTDRQEGEEQPLNNYQLDLLNNLEEIDLEGNQNNFENDNSSSSLKKIDYNMHKNYEFDDDDDVGDDNIIICRRRCRTNISNSSSSISIYNKYGLLQNNNIKYGSECFETLRNTQISDLKNGFYSQDTQNIMTDEKHLKEKEIKLEQEDKQDNEGELTAIRNKNPIEENTKKSTEQITELSSLELQKSIFNKATEDEPHKNKFDLALLIDDIKASVLSDNIKKETEQIDILNAIINAYTEISQLILDQLSSNLIAEDTNFTKDVEFHNLILKHIVNLKSKTSVESRSGLEINSENKRSNMLSLIDIKKIMKNNWIYKGRSESAPESPIKLSKYTEKHDYTKNVIVNDLKKLINEYQQQILKYEEDFGSIKFEKDMEYNYMSDLLNSMSMDFNHQKSNFELELKKKDQEIERYKQISEELNMQIKKKSSNGVYCRKASQNSLSKKPNIQLNIDALNSTIVNTLNVEDSTANTIPSLASSSHRINSYNSHNFRNDYYNGNQDKDNNDAKSDAFDYNNVRNSVDIVCYGDNQLPDKNECFAYSSKRNVLGIKNESNDEHSYERHKNYNMANDSPKLREEKHRLINGVSNNNKWKSEQNRGIINCSRQSIECANVYNVVPSPNTHSMNPFKQKKEMRDFEFSNEFPNFGQYQEDNKFYIATSNVDDKLGYRFISPKENKHYLLTNTNDLSTIDEEKNKAYDDNSSIYLGTLGSSNYRSTPKHNILNHIQNLINISALLNTTEGISTNANTNINNNNGKDWNENFIEKVIKIEDNRNKLLETIERLILEKKELIEKEMNTKSAIMAVEKELFKLVEDTSREREELQLEKQNLEKLRQKILQEKENLAMKNEQIKGKYKAFNEKIKEQEKINAQREIYFVMQEKKLEMKRQSLEEEKKRLDCKKNDIETCEKIIKNEWSKLQIETEEFQMMSRLTSKQQEDFKKEYMIKLDQIEVEYKMIDGLKAKLSKKQAKLDKLKKKLVEEKEYIDIKRNELEIDRQKLQIELHEILQQKSLIQHESFKIINDKKGADAKEQQRLENLMPGLKNFVNKMNPGSSKSKLR